MIAIETERGTDLELSDELGGWLSAACVAAYGKELRKGPRGGGRDLVEVVRHVIAAEASYLRRLGGKLPNQGDEGGKHGKHGEDEEDGPGRVLKHRGSSIGGR